MEMLQPEKWKNECCEKRQFDWTWVEWKPKHSREAVDKLSKQVKGQDTATTNLCTHAFYHTNLLGQKTVFLRIILDDGS